VDPTASGYGTKQRQETENERMNEKKKERKKERT
jgi:hypothetical protein